MGIIIKQFRYADGRELDDDIYVVRVIRDKESRFITHEEWGFQDDRLSFPSQSAIGVRYHREGAPAIIIRHPETGTVTKEAWYRDDELHREGGPADYWRDPYTGVIVEEKWAVDGRLHRTDGPAHIYRDRITGEVTRQLWRVNGEILPPSVRRKLSNQARTSQSPNPPSL